MDWGTFQTQVREWGLRNFPYAQPWEPLVGLVEEWGEFSESTTKAERADAIGDVLVYLAHYCALNNYNLGEIADGPEKDNRAAIQWNPPHVTLAHLARAHLKAHQGIRGPVEGHRSAARLAIGVLVDQMRAMACSSMIDFDKAVADTWAEVMERDWTADKVNGKAVAQ